MEDFVNRINYVNEHLWANSQLQRHIENISGLANNESTCRSSNTTISGCRTSLQLTGVSSLITLVTANGSLIGVSNIGVILSAFAGAIAGLLYWLWIGVWLTDPASLQSLWSKVIERKTDRGQLSWNTLFCSMYWRAKKFDLGLRIHTVQHNVLGCQLLAVVSEAATKGIIVSAWGIHQ